MMTEGTPEETEDSERPAGDLPGYVPTVKDWRIKEVYGDWVQSNDGSHLSGGVEAGQEWQAICRTLEVMPARLYDAPIGRVRCRFVQALAAELTGVWQSLWNAERFIFFQTETLQCSQHITNSCKIQR